MKMSEIWKPVPNTDGCIEVSSMGRVRSFLRGCTVLKQQTDAKGYLRLSVIKTGERLVFRSMCDAERAIGTKHISSVIKGERKQACGYTFSYAEGR